MQEREGTEQSFEEIVEIVYIDGKKYRKVKRRVKKKRELTAEQLDEIKQAFDLFDKDGSNTIDVNELRDAMKALGIYLKKDAVKKMMERVDKDGNGSIDLLEFQSLMAEKISERNPEEELRKAFRLYDIDDTGKITFENLKKVADDLKEELTEEEILDMIKEADDDKDGEVSLDEFIKLMKKAKLF